jgi:integrase
MRTCAIIQQLHLELETTLYKVQRLLGHKSPIMTQRYTHHYPESLREGVDALEAGRSVSTNSAPPRSTQHFAQKTEPSK